jgi:hypothetical protein
MNEHIYLHHQVHHTIGFTRALKYDIPRSKYKFVPNELVRCLDGSHGLSLPAFEERCITFGLDPSGTLKELLSEEVMFVAREGLAQRFPPMAKLFKSPWLVQSASLELCERTKEQLGHLARMRTRCVDLFCYDDAGLLLNCAEELIDLTPSYLGVFVPDQDRADALARLLDGHPLAGHISVIRVGSIDKPMERGQAPRQRNERTEVTPAATRHSNRLVLSMDHFMEAHSHHTYFNGRIHVTTDDMVRYARQEVTDLCSLEELADIASKNENWSLAEGLFRRWGAKKDRTDVCKDCELRRICMDRRVPLERRDGTWYHTQECTYNPYICLWKGDEGHRSLKECGVESDAGGFAIDSYRINAINAELWGE